MTDEQPVWTGGPGEDGADRADHPCGEIRLGPARAFGLRAAALAGLVVTTAGAAVLTSPLVGAPGTTCCTGGG